VIARYVDHLMLLERFNRRASPLWVWLRFGECYLDSLENLIREAEWVSLTLSRFFKARRACATALRSPCTPATRPGHQLQSS